ncbi:hypothetical protein Ahu01nite_027010 [Winogradskya humida]|uniref:Uncharacterized protein n=1 Tax=Winogradskya humida TaxID=113566 RepID=A0ABQ3ZLY1_9ACTN|nr:hypothetical protein Ahu01nite_027010 [Actinoplanes humidus]
MGRQRHPRNLSASVSDGSADLGRPALRQGAVSAVPGYEKARVPRGRAHQPTPPTPSPAIHLPSLAPRQPFVLRILLSEGAPALEIFLNELYESDLAERESLDGGQR